MASAQGLRFQRRQLPCQRDRQGAHRQLNIVGTQCRCDGAETDQHGTRKGPYGEIARGENGDGAMATPGIAVERDVTQKRIGKRQHHRHRHDQPMGEFRSGIGRNRRQSRYGDRRRTSASG
jgi:hypothetical protein